MLSSLSFSPSKEGGLSFLKSPCKLSTSCFLLWCLIGDTFRLLMGSSDAYKFFLSKEVRGAHELCYNFWNNQLFHDHPFFHGTCLLPLVLSLIPSLFVSATDLRSTTLEHLSDIALSLVSRCLLCSSTLPSLEFLPFLLTFPVLLFPCVH
jgi:hypothetical protein